MGLKYKPKVGWRVMFGNIAISLLLGRHYVSDEKWDTYTSYVNTCDQAWWPE